MPRFVNISPRKKKKIFILNAENKDFEVILVRYLFKIKIYFKKSISERFPICFLGS